MFASAWLHTPSSEQDVTKKTIQPGAFKMTNLINRFAKCESGTTAIEYGLMAALISVVIIGTVTSIGTKLDAKFAIIDGGL